MELSATLILIDAWGFFYIMILSKRGSYHIHINGIGSGRRVFGNEDREADYCDNPSNQNSDLHSEEKE
ncbi:hypothetical protein BPAE_0124g00100 [Botrytis paeoniae]|uniref:Uncharacterized protein n=1 Tax=Botrytis paeoniae TaxID=278948 RepID=A0A4Z1FKV9_9HELO|nr:hypothetical protein BPAE_0124g00100 [Botrytis paeoniae]